MSPELLHALAIAVAPGIAISLLIYMLDSRDREPVRLLLRCFSLGVLCVILPLAIQILAAANGWSASMPGLLNKAIFAFGVVGLSEELGKFLVLRYYAFRQPAFDEPFDGIVYSVMVGMGFATAENISYVMQFGIGTGWVRMFISVPAHAAFAVLMGYYAGLAKFIPQHRGTLLFTGLFWATAFHGAFDFFLFIGNSLFLMLASMFCLYIGIRLSVKAIRQHRELSARWREEYGSQREEEE